jgi:hypothetical protein
LIIIDDVSILTPWVANRVSMILQPISGYDQVEFGGKETHFVGDLLQLPPSRSQFLNARRLSTYNTCPLLALNSKNPAPSANKSSWSIVDWLFFFNCKRQDT